MNGASAALMVSDIPFPVPVGAVRIGQDAEGNFLVNPDEEWLLESPLDLVVAGTEEAILMVEAGANEITEAEILDALDIAHAEIALRGPARPAQAGRQGEDRDHAAAGGRVDSARSATASATPRRGHPGRRQARAPGGHEGGRGGGARGRHHAEADEDGAAAHRAAVQLAFDKLEKDIIRKRIAVDKKRPDGRAPEEIRDIWIEVGVAPRTHGSAIFTRGQTQAFSVAAALGTTRDEMRLDTLGLQETKHYFHHYNFPRSRWARPASCAARSAATSATARSPSGRSCRSCRRRVPVHDPRGVGHPRVERLELDGLGLRLVAVADGRRRADQGAGGRSGDGAHQGG